MEALPWDENAPPGLIMLPLEGKKEGRDRRLRSWSREGKEERGKGSWGFIITEKKVTVYYLREKGKGESGFCNLGRWGKEKEKEAGGHHRSTSVLSIAV